jgi:uncharacterized protein YggL (DUF469 family)
MQLEKRRKKRLRKKLCVAEFREFGFYVEFQLAQDMSETEEVLDRWLEFLDQHDWMFNGVGIHGLLSGFVVKAVRGSINEAGRVATAQWLAAQTWCTNTHVGPLQDAWHDEGCVCCKGEVE